MLRASQMLLAHAIRSHDKGRDWALKTWEEKTTDEYYHQIANWFSDCPSFDSFFGIHNMCAVGLRFDKFPGEWYGPQTACLVMKELGERFSNRMLANSRGGKGKGEGEENHPNNLPMKIVVAREGSVYIDMVESEMCDDGKQSTAGNSSLFQFGNSDDPLAIDAASEVHQLPPWHSSLLLLIPLRLGVKNINDKYKKRLSEVFGEPCSCGFVGGTPRFALWFYGSNGDVVYGLDPHTIQTAGRRDNSNNRFHRSHIKSLQCSSGKEATMNNLDPSLALAFYCKDRLEWEGLCERLSGIDGACSPKDAVHAPLFSLLKQQPNYETDVGVMDDLIGGGGGENEDDDDDDDFVFV